MVHQRRHLCTSTTSSCELLLRVRMYHGRQDPTRRRAGSRSEEGAAAEGPSCASSWIFADASAEVTLPA
eukprot:9421381-Pyramimonas_sp.AAC.1